VIAKLVLWLYSMIFPQCMVHVYVGPWHTDHAGEFIYVYEDTDEELNANAFSQLDLDWKRDHKLEGHVLDLPFVRGVACKETP
jgi:hypothetical protein